MLLEPIITSLLETDMYKFSMGQCIYHQFSDYKTTWSFKCRNTDVHFTHEMRRSRSRSRHTVDCVSQKRSWNICIRSNG